MPSATLSQLAALVDGKVTSGGDTLITDALPLQDAYAGCLTLADHPKHAARVARSTAAAVIVKEPLAGCSKPMLVVGNLHQAFAQIILFLRPAVATPPAAGVHATALIDPTAKLGAETTVAAGASVAANCVIGRRCILHHGVHIMAGCRLGDDCELFPGVTLYPDSRLGNRVLLHAGAVIGAYGFGYRKESGKHMRTAQLGWVELGDDVEIGAATTVDRGTYGPTQIGEGTKIDNQVQIGHNCHIGKHNLICAQVGIAGSTTTGDRVVLAGQVGVADHIQLADDVVVGAQAGVIGNLDPGVCVVGSPAAPRRQRMLEWALIAKLPEMRQELKSLSEQLAALQSAEPETASDAASARRAA